MEIVGYLFLVWMIGFAASCVTACELGYDCDARAQVATILWPLTVPWLAMRWVYRRLTR